MRVLVTGGAGYIGSHAALALLSAGHDVTIVDALVSGRGHRAAIDAVNHGAADDGRPGAHFAAMDINQTDDLAELLRARKIEAVMHFAALAYVGESVGEPLRYYRANTAGALSLLEAMDRANVTTLVFSSTCATYGEPPPTEIPIRETCAQAPINPYGRSKLAVEGMIRDVAQARHARGQAFRAGILRYFNVAGCDPAGRVGEDHRPETHLIPICLEAALGRRPHVTVFGSDYATADGTCIRDYIHVSDLVDAHVLLLEKLNADAGPTPPVALNLGLGRGSSVAEVVETCRRVTARSFEVRSGPRRPGDPPTLFADASRAGAELGWTPKFTSLEHIVESAWRWRSAHPAGYPGE